MGESALPGPATLSAIATVPDGARIVLLRDGQEVAAADGGAVQLDTATATGAYRVEVRLRGAPGKPPIPWVLSNPIYFLTPVPPRPAAPPDATPLTTGVGWHIEKDRGSTGSVVTSPEEVAFYYRLRGPTRSSQFVAAVAELQGRAPSSRGIILRASAVRPARVSVQLRYGSGGRWARSVYLDPTVRDIIVPIDRMVAADHQSGPPPPPSDAQSLLVVVDLTNAAPGSANTIRMSRVGFVR